MVGNSSRDAAYQAKRDAIQQADYESALADSVERIKYQHDYAQAALKNLMLVNGGAIIALLTFVGSQNAKVGPGSLQGAFFWYGAGLVLALVAYFGAYFSQAKFYQYSLLAASNAQHRILGHEEPNDTDRPILIGNLWLGLAVTSSFASAVAFAGASWLAIGAIA